MRVLLVGSDLDLSQDLVRGLHAQGIDTITADQGRSALERYFEVDAVVLDLTLPDMDGFQVCQQIRARSHVPIIVTNCREDELDLVLALKIGADDYVVKPVRLRELIARIEAAVRRAEGAWPSPAAPQTRQLGTLHIDYYQRRVMVDGRQATLTPKEYDLLALLASEPGRTFSREHIMQEVWGYGAADTRTLGVLMVSLRRKVGSTRIETVRGIGFRVNVLTKWGFRL